LIDDMPQGEKLRWATAWLRRAFKRFQPSGSVLRKIHIADEVIQAEAMLYKGEKRSHPLAAGRKSLPLTLFGMNEKIKIVTNYLSGVNDGQEPAGFAKKLVQHLGPFG
jgi:hypothetical protein